MAMQPTVLILDEPTSQLDPIAASEFLSTLAKINREFGTTVVLTEHRLDEAFPLASRAAVMEHGKIICVGSPYEVGAFLKEHNHGMFPAMPRAYADMVCDGFERTLSDNGGGRAQMAWRNMQKHIPLNFCRRKKHKIFRKKSP